MEGYIHFYEENTAFDADYNTPEYYEPWLSYTYDAQRTDYNKRNRAEETHLWLDGADASLRSGVDFRATAATVTVHAKGGWTASCSNCSASVTGVSDTAITETTVAVTFAANTSSEPRAVTVTFTNTSDRTITRALVVTQAGKSYVSMTAGGTAPYDGGAVELTVTTNIGATLSAPAGTSLDTASVGSGTSVVTLTVPARTSSQTAETSSNGTLRFTNPSATSSSDRVEFYYSGTGQTVTYYRTLSLLNVFRTTQTTGSCGDFYPRCKVTVSLNGKTSKSVTITGSSKQNDRGVWVGNGTVDISSWNIPVGTTCTGTITYLMISESGGSWSPSSWSGSLTGVNSDSTVVFLDDSNVVNLPSGAEGYFHFNCS